MDPHTQATPVPPFTAVPPPRHPAEPVQPAPGHITSTAERGSFCLAVCSCGWTGPARRSRDLARRDATRHSGE
ncbi:hypothetical protein Slala03_79490 [Streptomyces lavendulae subsp. lavendulae]|nr:hypothetical protein Slala03_79490 [Streptomyces lavendulae subsp. lavendulae]GLX41958.1 hypothetical protein Sros01_80300 [Streptomyces roseochromogenus]